MSEERQVPNIDFTVDKSNLYREEAITDLRVASIRRLVPIHPDGTDDGSRTPLFMGHTQLMSPEGPVPLQAKIEANSLDEAFDHFPAAMEQALSEVVDRLKKIQAEQQNQPQNDSRIIMPGR